MLMQEKITEPPLHRAILQDDLLAITILRENQEALASRNEAGYSALELARLLGKRKSIELLSKPRKAKIFKVEPEGKKYRELSVEDFEQLFQLTYTSTLLFPDYPKLDETLRDCPWLLGKSFVGDENRAAGAKYRPKFEHGYTLDLTIRWIDPEMGYGAFTNKDLNPGEYIGEYTGLVRRLYRSHPDQNAYCFHYPTKYWSWHYTVIDSLHAGNELRFINHRDRPNLRMIWALDRGLLHLVLVARQRIPRGSQLFIDYGKDYWMKRRQLQT